MSTGAPNETGTPIRMPSVALLCIDSADGVKVNNEGYIANDSTPAQININKQTPLMFGYMTRIALTEVNLQWATPNVNARNNTLTFRIADVSGTVPQTIPSGMFDPSGNMIFIPNPAIKSTHRVAIPEFFRTPKNLATILETYLNNLTISGVTNNFFVQHLETSGEFNISISGSLQGKIAISILPPGKQYTITSTYPANVFTGRVDDDLTYMMGLSPVASLNNYYVDTIRGGFASCQYTPYVDIVSSILTKNQNVHDNDSSIRNGQSKLARIYLSHPGAVNQFDIDEDGVINTCNIVGVRPFTLHKEFQTPKVISWNTTENIDIVDLQVLDHRGYPIYIENHVIEQTGGTVKLGNTASFQFTLQITET